MTFRTTALRLALPAAALASAAVLSTALPAGAATSVSVTENGSHVTVSKTKLPSGKVTFSITNKGTSPAAIALVRSGHKTVTSKKVAAGKKGTWTVTVSKGAYKVAYPSNTAGAAVLTATGTSTSSSGSGSGNSSSGGSGGYGY
jgi:iron uptake system component EfeO